jgi:uncharacterized membrane protein YfcA
MVAELSIFLIAALTATLTFYSGFGLGTMLLPTFAIFLPIEWAISTTAIVHLINNLVKLSLNFRYTHWKIALTFITTAIPFAFIGSQLFKWLLIQPQTISFTLYGYPFETFIHQIFIGTLMIVFAIMEWFPENKKPTFSSKWLLIGGTLSGFFGGLSGHQGALRSAFFMRTQMNKKQIIATGIIVACCIDFTRLLIYPIQWHSLINGPYHNWLWLAIGGASIGTVTGQFFIKKITIQSLKHIIALSLLIMGMAMILGKV